MEKIKKISEKNRYMSMLLGYDSSTSGLFYSDKRKDPLDSRNLEKHCRAVPGIRSDDTWGHVLLYHWKH